MSASELSANYTELTADIVSAYVVNNSVPAGHLPELIATIHKAVSGLSQPPAPVAEPQAPAVNPKRSVHPDYIISLERRETLQIAEASSHDALCDDTGRVPPEVGSPR
jgi:predicted transcriptional regulator